MENSLHEIEQSLLKQSGKFFSVADDKFAGNPKGLLEKTAEKVELNIHLRKNR